LALTTRAIGPDPTGQIVGPAPGEISRFYVPFQQDQPPYRRFLTNW